jgi:hypothetical protein
MKKLVQLKSGKNVLWSDFGMTFICMIETVALNSLACGACFFIVQNCNALHHLITRNCNNEK